MASPDAVGPRVDRLPLSAPIWRLVCLLSLGGCFEFYDLLMTAYISPGLVAAGIFRTGAQGLFGLSDQVAFASAIFAGLFVGTIAFARVADRFGRRTIFTGALLWYTVATTVMAMQSTAVALDVWRFIAGVGIGVELVTIDAYLVEIVPAPVRGRVFAVNQAIQFAAVPVVAFACWILVPRTLFHVAGWRWVVLLGAFAAIVVWFIRARLPESPRWLEAHGRAKDADVVLTRLEREVATATGPLPAVRSDTAQPVDRGRLRDIFRPPYRRRTIMLSVFNACQAIGFYGFGNWAPSLIGAQGQGVTRSLQYSFIIAIAYPIGPLLCGAIADRFEHKHQVVAAAVGTAAFGLIFSRASAPAALVALGVAITLSNNLLSYAFHVYQAELFPTRVRALAVGFVYSWSRLSTVFSSFVIAALLVRVGTHGVFAFIALAMGVVVVAVGVFGPRTNARPLEELSG